MGLESLASSVIHYQVVNQHPHSFSSPNAGDAGGSYGGVRLAECGMTKQLCRLDFPANAIPFFSAPLQLF
jgi:hypothetical protein